MKNLKTNKTRRLQLNRTTIRNLVPSELAVVAGGGYEAVSLGVCSQWKCSVTDKFDTAGRCIATL